MKNQIIVKNLCKRFKIPVKKQNPSFMDKLINIFYRKWAPVDVLNSISFNIKQGEFIGYVGPNGAGKSTTIKALTGILSPTSGEIKILGFSPTKDRYKYTYNIGVVFGQRRLLNFDIPVIDSMHVYKGIYELDDKTFNERLEFFNQMLKIKKYLHIPVRKLSLGERMRCEIAAALLHKPKIVFLDEPTIGLDAVAKEEIRNFLKQVNEKEKTTIILTTHDMDDIEETCKRIVLIDKGSIVYDGPLNNLKKRYIKWKTVEFEFSQIKDKEEFQKTLNKVKLNQKQGNFFSIDIDITNQNIPDIVEALMKSTQVIDMTIKEPSLEKIIKEIYIKGID